MNLLRWAEKGAQKMKWYHYSVLKVGVASAVLLLAKFFPVLLALDWYWYAGLVILSYIILLFKFFGADNR